MIKSPLSDTKIETEKMFGFYRGVVEDNNDPLKAGRVRVRIFGIHTSQLRKDVAEGIPVDELPWSEPCMPIVEGSISGFGIWGVPLQGSHVMIFFEAGNLSQPRYFATMPGIPESKFSLESSGDAATDDEAKGFRDPDMEYPLQDRLGEPDVDRLARGVTADTPVEFKNNNRTTGVSEADGGTWDEPVSPYNAEYPNNTVFQTHGGTLIELDSTSGEERLHLYHPSKSYIEIDADGVMVVKNTDKKYEIVVDDKNINIQGDNSETINGDDKLRVDGDVTQEFDGNVDQEVGGNVDQQIDGNVTSDIDGNLTVTVGGNITITSTGPTVVNAPNIQLVSASVQAGIIASVKKLMNETTVALYNAHQHNYSDTHDGAGLQPTTAPINNTLSIVANATSETEAS